MTHTSLALGMAFFFAVLVIGAAVGYALLQILFEVVTYVVMFCFALYSFLGGGWRRMDIDDWIGLTSLIIFASVTCAFVVGGLQP